MAREGLRRRLVAGLDERRERVGRRRVQRREPAALARARSWWGRVAYTADGDSVSADVQGVNPGALTEEAPAAEITAVALEYGVVPVMDTLNALRADNWLYTYGKGDTASPLGKKIKAEIRGAFYGETDDWKERVYAKGAEVLRQAFKGLQA